MSHSYQTYFDFPRSDLNLDCGLRDHVITRFASTILVNKLNLNILKHGRPYKLRWLNKYGEVMVTKQGLIFFQLESIRMMIYVIWFPCILVIYYWGDLDNLTKRSSIIDLKISILLRRMKGHTHFHRYHLDMFIKIN